MFRLNPNLIIISEVVNLKQHSGVDHMPHNIPDLPDYAPSCRVDSQLKTIACDDKKHQYRNYFIQNIASIDKDAKPDSVDEMFYCPISANFIEDPVITPDGTTYERSLITRWVEVTDTDPMSRQRLRKSDLRSNNLAKDITLSYLENTKGIKTEVTQASDQIQNNISETTPTRTTGFFGRTVDDVIKEFNERLSQFSDKMSELAELPKQTTAEVSEMLDNDEPVSATTASTVATTSIPSLVVPASVFSSTASGDTTSSSAECSTVGSHQGKAALNMYADKAGSGHTIFFT